ncbi:MAG: hypothetical protein J6B16_03190 [Clostridia bacterium]|nr:hypothetical protein [Clostridia bacterium]
MQLNKSKTLINLARSFAGEAQAGLRYQFIAEKCLNAGYKILSDEIKSLAKNEVKHAKVFFDFIVNDGGYQNIEFTAGYPFMGQDIKTGLENAVKSEKDESLIYDKFAQVAIDEGFDEIAKKYKLIAEVERQHADKLNYLLNGYDNDQLYNLTKPTMWRCSECGHIETSSSGWDVCPLCGSTQGFIEIKL